MSDVYAFWRASKTGSATASLLQPTLYPAVNGVVSGENPQPGIWLISSGGGFRDGIKQEKTYLPMQVWLEDRSGNRANIWESGLKLCGTIGTDPATPDQLARRWLGSRYLSVDDRDFWFTNSKWPWDLPEPVAASPAKASDVEFDAVTTAVGDFGLPDLAAPAAKGSVPGDNAGDAKSFQAMREQIRGEIAEAEVYFKRNPIKTKTDADLCENWRKRIWALSKEADQLRDKEKRPHDERAAEVQKRWKPLIDEAQAAARNLEQTADVWVKAEQRRLRDEAEKKAREEFEAEQKARAEARAKAEKERAEQEARIAAIAADNPAIAAELPELPDLPPEPEPVEDFRPVIETPKVMIGTTGNRRSAKSGPATATIIDLKAAAAYFAGQNHPDMVALIQKLADKAAKARAEVPGIRMSWQASEAAE